MKYYVKEDKVTILLESKWDDPAIELALRALACCITGVDYAGLWSEFSRLNDNTVRALMSRLTDLEGKAVEG